MFNCDKITHFQRSLKTHRRAGDFTVIVFLSWSALGSDIEQQIRREIFPSLHRKDKKKCGESTKRKDDGLGTGGSKTFSVNHPEKKAFLPRSLSACVQNRLPFPFDSLYY